MHFLCESYKQSQLIFWTCRVNRSPSFPSLCTLVKSACTVQGDEESHNGSEWLSILTFLEHLLPLRKYWSFDQSVSATPCSRIVEKQKWGYGSSSLKSWTRTFYSHKMYCCPCLSPFAPAPATQFHDVHRFCKLNQHNKLQTIHIWYYQSLRQITNYWHCYCYYLWYCFFHLWFLYQNWISHRNYFHWQAHLVMQKHIWLRWYPDGTQG